MNGTNTGTIQVNGSSPACTLGNFASTFQTPPTVLSTQLNAVVANSTASSSGGTVTFKAKANSGGAAIFDVNTSLFSWASSMTFNRGGATSVIINVNVGNCVSNVCAVSLGSLNFVQGPTDYISVAWGTL